jgi:hypothetical protein
MKHVLPFLIILLAFERVLVAQDKEREVPLPYVTLVQPPSVPKLEATQLPKDRVDEIKQLIAGLSALESKDIGLLRSSPFSTIFVPVGEFNGFGDRTDRKVETFPQIRKLIEIGPDALPFLLDSLDNDTPTALTIKAAKTDGAISGGMDVDEILHGNPANPTERFVLNLDRHPYSASIRPKGQFDVASKLDSYQAKVGDVCLVIIGQIVGRDYECLIYDHVKSLGVLVCSPVHQKSIREKLRRIWESKNPRQKVLESLLLDFSTRGVLQMDSLDHWSIGSDFQIRSAMRLLYYYPTVATSIVSKRAAELRVSGDYFDDCVANGLCTDDFIDGIGWTDSQPIRTALEKLAESAKDNNVVRSLERSAIKIPNR